MLLSNISVLFSIDPELAEAEIEKLSKSQVVQLIKDLKDTIRFGPKEVIPYDDNTYLLDFIYSVIED